MGGALEQQGLCAWARQVGKEGKRLRKEEEKFRAFFSFFIFRSVFNTDCNRALSVYSFLSFPASSRRTNDTVEWAPRSQFFERTFEELN